MVAIGHDTVSASEYGSNVQLSDPIIRYNVGVSTGCREEGYGCQGGNGGNGGECFTELYHRFNALNGLI